MATISEYQLLMATQQQKIDQAKESAIAARQQIGQVPISELLRGGQAEALARGVSAAREAQQLSAYEAGIASAEKELQSKTLTSEQLQKAYISETGMQGKIGGYLDRGNRSEAIFYYNTPYGTYKDTAGARSRLMEHANSPFGDSYVKPVVVPAPPTSSEYSLPTGYLDKVDLSGSNIATPTSTAISGGRGTTIIAPTPRQGLLYIKPEMGSGAVVGAAIEKGTKLYGSEGEMTSPVRTSIFKPVEKFIEAKYESTKELGQYGLLGSIGMIGGQVVTGIASGVVGTAKSIAYPVETVKSLWYAGTHPMEAGAAFGEHFQQRPIFAIGEIYGTYKAWGGIYRVGKYLTTPSKTVLEVSNINIKPMGTKEVPISADKNIGTITFKTGEGYDVIGSGMIKSSYPLGLKQPTYQPVSLGMELGVVKGEGQVLVAKEISKGITASKAGDLYMGLGRGSTDTLIKGKRTFTPFVSKQYAIDLGTETINVGESISKTGRTLGVGASKEIAPDTFGYLGITSTGKEAFPSISKIKIVSPAVEEPISFGSGTTGTVFKTPQAPVSTIATQAFKQAIVATPKASGKTGMWISPTSSSGAYAGLGLYELSVSGTDLVGGRQTPKVGDMFMAGDLNVFKQGSLNLQRQGDLNLNAFKGGSRLKQAGKQIQSPILTSIQDFSLMQSSAQEQVSLLGSAQRNAQQQRTAQASQLGLGNITTLPPWTKVTPSTTMFRKTKSLFSKTKAYQTFLKRKGKYKPIGILTTKAKAIMFGEQAARTTLAASFKVMPSKKEIFDIGTNRYQPSAAFRTYKIHKGRKIPLQDEWIQRRGTRLGSFGERREIKASRRKSFW